MLNQTFTAKNLRLLLRRKDFIKFKLIQKDGKYLKDVEKISGLINSGVLLDSDVKKLSLKGKNVFCANTLHNTIVLRKLDDNIKRLYKVKQSDRMATVKKISCILEDMVPMWITKVDMKDFYESIDRAAILKKLCSDSLLSYQSKKVLKVLFDNDCIKNEKGVPRGLCLSSTLSEIYLRNLDTYVASMEGVYFYARYVDDVIVFSYQNSDQLFNNIKSYVETSLGMKFNARKTVRLKINCKCDDLCRCLEPKKCKLLCACTKETGSDISFDYLGYGFRLKDNSKKSVPGKPIIYLSEKKVKKYKTRICLAFKDYVNSKDFDLLKKRVKFITGNCLVDPTNKSSGLKTGVYYNYQLLNNTDALTELDVFYLRLLYSKKGTLGFRLNSNLSSAQKDYLKKYSFVSGYNKRIFHKFTVVDLNRIKECWCL